MDSLFDDDHDEVGSDIEAYCPSPRCKADTNHTIISMYEDEIRRVQCSVCGDVHAYRKPRGEAYDLIEEPPLRQKLSKKPSWEEAMLQVTEAELQGCRPYSIRDTYEELDVVSHPKFGVGFVTELLPDNKVEITFKDERRVLVHNRSDLAPKMPAIAEMPPPREQKKRRRRKKGASELAAKLLSERLRGKEVDEETAQVKRLSAERAADAKRKLAQRLAGDGVNLEGDLDERTRKRLEREREREQKRIERENERERKRLEREEERARKAKEREEENLRKAKERERAQKEKERERARAQKEKERERARAQKEKERERARAQKEKERERARKEKERERAQREKERERAQREKERARAQKEKERERARKEKERERKQKAQLRRTGGKKSVSARPRPAKKKAPTTRRTPKRTPAKRGRKRR